VLISAFATIALLLAVFSFVPLYQQIKDLLLNRIEHGELAAGDVIPSEAQLGAAFKVSRLTVRQVLYELRVEDYVILEKGRGTFVRGSAV
jgi:GntR family transcriptional regulator